MNPRPGFLTVVAACAIGLVITPAVARAANTTCANADFLFHNERASNTLGASSNLFYKTNVVAGRSYAVMAWGPTQDVGEGGVSVSVDLFSDNTCTTTAGGTDQTDNEPTCSASSVTPRITTTSSPPRRARFTSASTIPTPPHTRSTS